MSGNFTKADNIVREDLAVRDVHEATLEVTRFGGYPEDDTEVNEQHTNANRCNVKNEIENRIDASNEKKVENHEEKSVKTDQRTNTNDVKITILDDTEKVAKGVTPYLQNSNSNGEVNAVFTLDETNGHHVDISETIYKSEYEKNMKTSSWKLKTFKGWTQEDIKWLHKTETRFREIAGTKGNITFEQFTKALGLQKSTFYAERIFKIFNQDDSGRMELGELLDGIHMLAKGRPEEKLKFLFDVFDEDGNGHIDRRELQEVLQACIEESSMTLSDENLEDLTEAMFVAIDKDNDGTITFDELKEELQKQPEVLHNLTISAAHLLKPIEQESGESFCRYLTKNYLMNNYRKVGYIFIYWALNIALFAIAMWQYRESNTWIMVARGGGLCLNFNCMWVLVLMLRNCLTYIRTTFLSHVLPLDQHIMFHKMTAIAIVIFAILHTLAHIANAAIVANVNVMEMWEVLFTVKAGVGFVGGSAFITGWLLDVVLIVIVICSLPFIRRGGHFQVFYWTHLLYVPFWILVILHGPQFWKWFVGPGTIFLLEKISRSKAFRLARHGETYIKEVNLLPSRVTHLVIDRPGSFRYKPGDYLFLQIPAIATHEWHPFTISSAPEMEGHIWLHVRSAGHWTNKLYDYFENLEYSDKGDKDRTDYSKGNTFERFEKAYVERATRINLSQQHGKTISKREQNHKKVSVKCFLDGPYGTGTREVFDTDHAVLVGAGIGITPMASILQSVWYKFNAARQKCPNCQYVWLPDTTDIKLKKVDFIWVNRDQKCFEWFVSLLTQIEHEQIQHDILDNRIQIHMYMTSAQKKTDLKGIGLQVALDLMYDKSGRDLITGLRTKTEPGRPDWDKIFKDIKAENNGKVKVFVCGPPTLAKTLKEEATKHKFAFSKENF
ncbi:NADPH oxidase 5-like [Mercenaria mercenaria]|uniref:NADPH oxidase 5-like n=1 Tax=Mercenaria mercenaria TaxID=6596 RepID=UPI00234E80C4|nr:NADPH oxidase 5-like [Mercenaria mercenaria]